MKSVIGRLTFIALGVGVLLAFAGGDLYARKKGKFLDVSKTEYLKREGKDWKKTSRLAGELLNPPETFTIRLVPVGGAKATFEITYPGELSVYQTPPAPIGTYSLTISAEGYESFTVSNVLLKPGHDCLINIRFDRE